MNNTQVITSNPKLNDIQYQIAYHDRMINALLSKQKKIVLRQKIKEFVKDPDAYEKRLLAQTHKSNVEPTSKMILNILKKNRGSVNSIKFILDSLVKDGWVTSSQHPNTLVGTYLYYLYRDKKIKRVGRGLYSL